MDADRALVWLVEQRARLDDWLAHQPEWSSAWEHQHSIGLGHLDSTLRRHHGHDCVDVREALVAVNRMAAIV